MSDTEESETAEVLQGSSVQQVARGLANALDAPADEYIQMRQMLTELAGPAGACFGLIFAAMGGIAIYVSNNEDQGDQCPFDLKKYLLIYGIIMVVTGAFSCLGLCCKEAAACVPIGVSNCQCIMALLGIFALMSYLAAEQCGMQVWWASMIFGSPCLALFIKCCCAPKAVSAVAAPRLLAAGVLTKSSAVAAHAGAAIV